MQTLQKIRYLLLCIALLGADGEAFAFSLGKVHGAILLGHPLDLTVAIQNFSPADDSGACFEADVYYGDNRVSPAHVSVTVLADKDGSSATVSVSASDGVNEPVVSLELRYGCGERSARKYVLFSEIDSGFLPPVRVETKSRSSEAALAALPDLPASPVLPALQDSAGTSIANVDKNVSKKRSSINKAGGASARGTSRAHLKLSTLDVVERDPSMHFSDDLASPVDESATEKRSQSAALWQTLSADPETLVKQKQELDSLSVQLKVLTDQEAKSAAALQDLNRKVQETESDRFSGTVVYVLAALLAACLATLFYLWKRANSYVPAGENQWWDQQDDHPRSTLMETFNTVVDEQDTQAPEHNSHPFDLTANAPTDKLSLATAPMEVSPALVDQAQPAAKKVLPVTEQEMPRDIKSKEVLDVRQQAEFFVALGRNAEAVQTLENAVRVEAADPPIYLDLLQLLHAMGRRQEFEKYRSEFNRAFTGRVPFYSAFGTEKGKNLDHYPNLVDALVQEWSTGEALEMVDACLTRTSDMSFQSGIDMEAFRELLMLRGVLQKLAQPLHSGFLPLDRSHKVDEKLLKEADDHPLLSVDLDLSAPDL